MKKLLRIKKVLGGWALACLLFVGSIVEARSLGDELQHFLFQEDATYGADSSGVSLSSVLNLPLYSRKKDTIADSLHAVDINVVDNKLRASYVRPLWGSQLSVVHRHKNLSFETHRAEDVDAFVSSHNALQARVDLWMYTKYSELGLSVGRYFLGDSLSFNHMSVEYDHPFTSFQANPKSSYALWWNTSVGPIKTEVLYDRTVPLYEPMHISKSSGSFKNLPLIMFQNRFIVKGGLQVRDKEIFSYWERKKLDGEKVLLDNGLPFLSEWLSYKIGLDAKMRRHSLSLSALTSMGSLFGYEDDDANAPRYAIFDDLYLKRLIGDYRFRLSPLFTIGARGEMLKANTPEEKTGNTEYYGTIEFYPFSSWSLFKPVKYRFSKSLLNYNCSGISTRFYLGRQAKVRTTLGFDCDVHQARIKTIREQRKIVVLVPIYINETELEPLHLFAFSGDLIIKQEYQIKKALLTFSMKQLIPLYLNDKNSVESSSNDGPSVLDKKNFGGFNASLSLTLPF